MSTVAEVVAGLELLDVSVLSREEVQGAYRGTRQVRGWVDVFEGRLARRLSELAESNGAIVAEADIAAASKSTRAEASKATKRAKTLGEVPQLEDALAAGDVSAEHVDAVNRASRRLKPEDRAKLTGDGDELAAIASRSTPEQFETYLKAEIARIDSREGGERLLRQKRAIRLRSWTDKESGMVIVRAELDPETGTLVLNRISKTVERLFHDRTPEDCPTDPEAKQEYLRAAAFTRLVLRRKAARTDNTENTDGADRDDVADDADTTTGDPVQPDLFSDVADAADTASTAGEPDETVTDDPDNVTGLEITDYDNTCDILVVIDLETMLHGMHEHSIIDNGTPHDLPIESYRRMACTAAIIPVVLDSDGVCLDLGRDVRLANRAQRRALTAMYNTCAIPGCNISSRHCQPHHVIWSTRLGNTDLDNLLPLCCKHHHAVHEGGWHLILHPNRSLTITYPDGRIQQTGPPATYQRPGRAGGRPANRGSPKPKPEAA